MRIVSQIIALGMLCLSQTIASAQTSQFTAESRLAYVEATLKSDESIVLVSSDGQIHKGVFKSIDAEMLSIVTASNDDSDAFPHNYRINDLSRLEYTRRGKLDSRVIVRGTLIGLGVGLLIGLQAGAQNTGSEGSTSLGALTALFSTVVGGFVGLTAGTIISAETPRTYVIEF